MKRFLLSLFAIAFAFSVTAQVPDIHQEPHRSNELQLSEKDVILHDNLPQLRLSAAEREIELPSYLDNSRLPYMIPIFYQMGNECGQASSICYTLSYELMRKRDQHADWGFDFQYPARFAWNFCNDGRNVGANFMESWELVRTAGTPTVNEWGGWYNFGSETRWISGYDIYHSAMKNRISEMYAIHIDSEEGLLTLKHWLNDHLAGESTGGLANFYCTYIGTSGLSIIPQGSPQAGKYILPNFNSYVNHSKTIVGYDDSICWDYNMDGRFTNDEDINHDGVVDIKDWEIGAVIFCNTFGPEFGNNGFCYLPYCKLASLPEEGGIWNSTVYVVQVKDEVFPQVTYKATIQHTSREKLKITAGIANNTAATVPEHILDFHIFDNQGGDMYMLGDETEEAKTIEFGLDVSPLLNYAVPNQPCKFFFNVEETDPDNEDIGAIVNFSLMDYTSGTEVEQACPLANAAIVNNTTTTLSVVRAINFSKPVIQDSLLPDMDAFSPYRKQLTATSGKPPYRWEISRDFEIESISDAFPSDEGQSVALSGSSSGRAIIPLNFDFPYYGDTYNQIIAYSDGYIAFHHQPANWPFLQEEEMQAKAIRMICPFKGNLSNCSIRKISESDAITIIYQAQAANQSSSSLNFAVKLHKDGNIEFLYGNMTYSGNNFTSMLSRGDQITIQYLPTSGRPSAEVSNHSYRLTPSILPDCLTLSSSGSLTGKSTNAFEDKTFRVTCYDNNDVKTSQELHISSIYASQLVFTDVKVNGEAEPSLYTKDTMKFTVRIRNIDTLSYPNNMLHLRTDDPYVQIIDSTEYFGNIGPGNEYTLNRCVACVIKSDIPDNHPIHVTLQLENDIAPSTTERTYTAHTYNISPDYYAIHDYGTGATNSFLDPIELDSIIFTMTNNGVKISNANLVFRTDNPNIIIAIDTMHLDEIATNEQFSFPTVVYVSPNFVPGSTVTAYVDIYANNVLATTKIFTILNEATCYDFESGDMPASFFGAENQVQWFIDNTESYSGGHSLRSGTIDHNDTTSLNLSLRCVQGKELVFAMKLSTETKYDKLYCYLDSIEMGNWSGQFAWQTIRIPIPSGEHLLTWKYIKDYSVSSGSDCVWIDDICFSELFNESYSIDVVPNPVEVSLDLRDHRMGTVALALDNTHGSTLLYNNTLVDEDGAVPQWVSISPERGYVPSASTDSVILTFTTYNCTVGDYYADLQLVHSGEDIIIPIIMHVSEESGIAEHNEPQQVLLYPNPTTGTFHIKNEASAFSSISCYDVFGRLIFTKNIDSPTTSIDMGSFPSGIYLIKMEDRNGGCHTEKLIKK